MSHHQISLDTLFSRDVAVQWFEGVALVQSVCRQISSNGSEPSGFPSPAQIVLSKDGSVTILGSSWSGNPVEGAARLLLDLLSGDVPVQLRLLMSQAAGLDGTHPTLSDFSTALAYFERSTPRAILQELFGRAVTSAALETPRGRSTDAAPAKKEPEKKPASPAEKKAAAERKQQFVLAATAVVLLGVAAWFLLVGPGRVHVSAAGESVMKQLGLGVPGPAEPAPSPEPLEKNTASSKATSAASNSVNQHQTPVKDTRDAKVDAPRPAAVAKAAVSTATSVVASPAGSPTAELLPGTPDGMVTYVVPASPVRPSEVKNLIAEGVIPDSRVYSANDSQVKPPRNIYPTFPEPPADMTIGVRTVVDVVVADNGLVEHVRLRNRPRDIHEFMLVSAAKAWRFEPATLGGRPVRFLHSLTIIRQ